MLQTNKKTGDRSFPPAREPCAERRRRGDVKRSLEPSRERAAVRRQDADHKPRLVRRFGGAGQRLHGVQSKRYNSAIGQDSLGRRGTDGEITPLRLELNRP